MRANAHFVSRFRRVVVFAYIAAAECTAWLSPADVLRGMTRRNQRNPIFVSAMMAEVAKFLWRNFESPDLNCLYHAAVTCFTRAVRAIPLV